ncbi:DUF4282 domain-containing protein [Natranaerobius trueperi]|uniref:DUF4282 domain-containing protein n=1 Tax=Natranaerobius trueperi TaxID=759412 RepID=A0A226C0W7_9FIRM|nr:DUF4282 domain-containing protein [Natranaerobius trueperi]OWZ84672.1 hypothetical protein CDO51_02610 [Natranaerobius trueperi]
MSNNQKELNDYLREFVSFNKMITPTIIKIIFWIGVAVSIFIGLSSIVSGMAAQFGGGFQVFFGLIILVVGPLTSRVYCELLIVIFKMHESLNNIDNKLSSDSQQEITEE